MISLDEFEKKYKDMNYFVSIPSAEVIYADMSTIYNLLNLDLVELSEMRQLSDLFISYDADKKQIKKIIEKLSIEKKNEISGFLFKCGLKSDTFEIKSDFSIDVFGSIDMMYMNLKKIPYKFNRCAGSFICSYNSLSSLKNSPRYVGNKFDCSYNNLGSLIGGPLQVNTYLCNNNLLRDLKGSPKYVKYFNCGYNHITSYDDAPKVSSGGKIISQNNPVLYDKEI